MKNLRKFKQFEISKELSRNLRGGCEAAIPCMQTAYNNGNPWLIPVCIETLCPQL